MEQLPDIINLNIHTSCRSCLENLTEACHNIFIVPDLGKKFTLCTSLPVEPDDGFPTSLCDPCLKKINDFYNFQQMCISSRHRFQNFINPEIKPCAMDLAAIDPIKLQTDLLIVKEENEEQSMSSVECLKFTTPEYKTLKKESDSSSQDEDESDNDKSITKYGASEDETSINDNSQQGENKDVKLVKSNTKTKSDTVIALDCEICKKTFKKKETFSAHMRVHSGLKPFPCHLCDISYVRRSRLRLHIKTIHEGVTPEKFPCTEPGCERILCSKQNLRKHINEIHHGIVSKVKKSYICEECGKVLTSLATLKNHRFLHTGQQFPHECPQCHKRYITKHKLKEHMNRHAGIKNYICPQCGARKTTRTELKAHINYHTKEKTYPCRFCDIVFNRVGSFNRHMRIVHEGIKNYPCSYCEKSFGKAETRRHHEMIHTGEKPHECNICHKKFIQPVALKKHKKIHLKAVVA